MPRSSSPLEIFPLSPKRSLSRNTSKLQAYSRHTMRGALPAKDLDPKGPDPIEILVGPEEHRFLAPRRLLGKVPFFRACLGANMQENTSGVVRLPEDDYQAFVEVMYWIFHHMLGEPPSMRMVDCAPLENNDFSKLYVLRHPDIALAAKTYNLGRKLGMEDLPNSIIDELRRYKARHPQTTDAEFFYIFKSPVVEEQLRDFFLGPIVMSIRELGWNSWLDANRSIYEELLDGQATNMELLLSAALPAGDRTPQIYRACEWHIHIDSISCVRPLPKPDSLLNKRVRTGSSTSIRKERSSMFDVLAEDSDGG